MGIFKLKKNKKINATLERASAPVRWIWPRMSEAVIGILCIFLVLFALLTYSTTVSEYTSRLVQGNKHLALVEGLLNPFRNKHILLKSGLPIYDLKIKRQPYAVLENVAQKAIKQGWMSDDMKIWVNGQFYHNGEKYNVKVRLRGDLPRHWNGPKKSWRIKFGKQKIDDNGQIRKEPIYFNGKRQINLIVPIDREYALAKFINSLMREKGLTVPRDDFVVLRLNGVLQGLYYEIEHFDKPLLAANRRPETTVFAQNDRPMHFQQYTKYGTPAASDAKFDIGSMRRLVERSGELGMQAMNVLINHSLNPTEENFRRARAVLDWRKYLTFRVMTTLLNTNHVRFGSDNFRLFYDSSRGLLEPIPWDAHLVKMPKEPGTIDFWNNHGTDELQRATLLDPMLRLERNRLLWEFIGDGGDSLIKKYRKIHDHIRPFVWADVLSTPVQGHHMDTIKKNFEYNVRRVYKVLNNSSNNFTYRLEANDLAALEVNVMNFGGIELQSIQVSDSLFKGSYSLFEDTNENGKFDRQDVLVTETKAVNGTINLQFDRLILPDVKYDHDTIKGRYWEFFDTITKRKRFFLKGKLADEYRHPLLWNPPEIQVVSTNAISGYKIPSAVISQTDPLPDNMMGITAYDHSDVFDLDAIDDSITEFLQKNPQFQASREQPDAVELEGKVAISGTVIIPKNILLILKAGTDLTMRPRASILSYGGLKSIGTPDHRIKIHGDETGRAWGVIAVVRSPKVVMKYTDLSDGGQAQINGILFTGGFAVHETDLELEQCRFREMESEDGVNIKNGNILMTQCEFTLNDSDAIDIDFGTGQVIDCKFSNIGGDGIDFSGSKVTVSGCWFEKVADKAISVGENSNPTIVNNFFKNNEIAISTKDLSLAQIAYCTFVNNRLAIEAKRKKPMFGAGTAEIFNSVFYRNRELINEDYFSKGKVVLKHSLIDQEVSEPTNKFAKIEFISPGQNNYLLDPRAVMSNGFKVKLPRWLKGNIDELPSENPGVFSLYSNNQN